MTNKTTNEPPVVGIKPNTYRPTKTEFEEDVSIDASPEDVIGAAFRPAPVVEDPDA